MKNGAKASISPFLITVNMSATYPATHSIVITREIRQRGAILRYGMAKLRVAWLPVRTTFLHQPLDIGAFDPFKIACEARLVLPRLLEGSKFPSPAVGQEGLKSITVTAYIAWVNDYFKSPDAQAMAKRGREPLLGPEI